MAAIASTTIDVTVTRALIESDGRTLLVRRASWDTLPGQWELPGGKVDRGEPLREALAREVEEEAGLMIASSRLLSTREMLSPRGRSVREHVYAASAIGTVSLSNEHDAHVWVRTLGDLRLTSSAEAAFSVASQFRRAATRPLSRPAVGACRHAWPHRPTRRTRAGA